MRYKVLRRAFPLIALGVLTLPAVLTAEEALSHVRVVRLSYISGMVTVRRPDSTEPAKAMVNTPLQEGFEISTSANSYAEVEFENGSTARLGEDSKLTLEQLALDADGNKLNRVAFTQGYATFHLMPERHDSYSVKVAETTLTPNGKCVFRTDLTAAKARLEVFSGSIQIATTSSNVKLGKDRIVEFDPGATEVALNTTSGIVKDSWDKWTSSRDTQAQLALNDQGISGRSAVYGWSDLDAYGEWGFFPGFGYGWSPFASMGWAPYSMGMWSWYSGMGYTWISGEPWGWMPYHYGNWNYSPGFGWFWMPGGSSAFSPALVNWYSGPGWVGWAPRGVRARPGQNIVNTTSGSAIQNGVMITPQNVIHVPAGAGTVVNNLQLEPGAGARLPGQRFTAGPETNVTAHVGATRSLAPPSILMGGNAAAETSLQGRHFNQPIRSRMGTTLGGQYQVGGNLGEFRGDAFKGTPAGGPNGPLFNHGNQAGGPTFVPHGQGASNSAQTGGGAAASSRSGGGGNSGGGGGAGNSMGGGAHVGSPVGGRH